MVHLRFGIPVVGFFVLGLLVAAKPPLKPSPTRPVVRVDRMWLVGEPPLDGRPQPGVYAWIAQKNLEFAVVPQPGKRARVYQWSIASTKPVRLVEGGDCRIAARREYGLVLAARPVAGFARCMVISEGEFTLSRVLVGRRSAPTFLGPLAYKGASKIRIGSY